MALVRSVNKKVTHGGPLFKLHGLSLKLCVDFSLFQFDCLASSNALDQDVGLLDVESTNDHKYDQ